MIHASTSQVIAANDADVTQLEAAAVSKAIRTLGEKLLPPHSKAEWKDRIWATLENAAAKDPDAELKKILEAFALRRIMPRDLEDFLGHPVALTTPAEIVKLRGVFMAISEGVASWADVVSGPPAEGEKPTAGQAALLEKIREQQAKVRKPEKLPSQPTEADKDAAVDAQKAENGQKPAAEQPKPEETAATAPAVAKEPSAEPSASVTPPPEPQASHGQETAKEQASASVPASPSAGPVVPRASLRR